MGMRDDTKKILLMNPSVNSLVGRDKLSLSAELFTGMPRF